jgi:hypothetical protein
MLTVALPVRADVFVHEDIIRHPSTGRFSVCLNHSCETIVTQAISHEDWQRVSAPLQPAAPTDKGGNLRGFGLPGQMDCIDESTNATSYLYLLESAGLLQHHTLTDRSTRFGLFVGMPHTTAVIRETATGRRYAVDSWFFDNGQPPAIIELSAWKAGWRPGDAGE